MTKPNPGPSITFAEGHETADCCWLRSAVPGLVTTDTQNWNRENINSQYRARSVNPEPSCYGRFDQINFQCKHFFNLHDQKPLRPIEVTVN